MLGSSPKPQASSNPDIILPLRIGPADAFSHRSPEPADVLKFLRKYQKWMLAVFCVGLMIAFLVPQAAQQFAPQSGKKTRATIYGDQEITQETLNKVSGDLSVLRRLRLDPVRGFSLVPSTGDDGEDAYYWLLLQRAAEHNGLGASRNESFNLLASVLDVQDEDELDAEAKKQFSANGEYLMQLGRQYLIAEQYRQMVAGIEYTAPIGGNQIASPGLQRLYASTDAMRVIEPQLQQFQQIAQFLPPQQQQQMLLSIFNSDPVLRATGHERVTAAQVQHLLQRQLTELDLTVVVLDAEDRRASVSVDDEKVQALFERFADDAPGTGQPYGLGYRVPDRVRLEALRFPIDAVREAVEDDVKRADIRKYFDENRTAFDLALMEEGGTPPANRPTAAESEQIELTLIQNRTEEKLAELAQQARLRLNEQTRGFEKDGAYKKLPDGFEPMPLAQLAAELEQEHGVAAEVIQVEDWVTREDINNPAAFTRAFVRELPGTSVNSERGPRTLRSVVLGGRAGLFASFIPFNQGIGIADYVMGFARPFIDDDSDQARAGLQVGLPGEILLDESGSAYVLRLTAADPSHPATDLGPIADQVRQDALDVEAYLALVGEKDALVELAASGSIERLMDNADAKKTLTALTREELGRGVLPPMEGVGSTAPILEQAFAVADELSAGAGVDGAAEADRVFAVELPGDYKLAIVRVDKVRPLTRSAFNQQASRPSVLANAARLGRPADAPNPMSLESLMAATQFQWAEGFGPETLGGGEEDEDADEEE